MRAMAVVKAIFVVGVVMALATVSPAWAVTIQRVISPGGIEAWLVEDQKVPVITMNWSFEGAGAVAPAGKEGLATLAASTMDEGAGDLDSEAFHNKLADLAVRFSFNAGRENFAGTLTTLRDNRDAAFDLARLALTKPRFDQDAVDRIRAELVAEVQRDQSDPNHLARRAMFANAFPGHPYGIDDQGSVESLNAITTADLATFVKGQLGRDRLLVAVAGAITPDELGKVLDLVFGGLAAKSTVPAVTDVQPQGAGKTVSIDLPTAQTIVLMTGPGLQRSSPDWYAAQMVMRVVGGGDFNTRLMQEVRVKRGLTYGIYAANVSMAHSALVYISGSTVNAKAGEMIKVARDVWGDIGRQGITEQELQDAKTYLTGALPLQFESTASTAGIILQIRRDGLPIDILDKRDALINSVTLSDVQRVSQKLFNPDALMTVLVGKPEGINK